MSRFLKLLALQRWDDHRYYHQSRINQSLHFISAVSFLCAYVVLFFDPALAALIAWLVSMTTRQAGHFFFEPRGYDHVNQASDEHKEAIKVGYNLRRKIVLLSVWALLPLLLWLLPDMGGLIVPAVGVQAWLHDVGMAWLALGVGGVLLRTVHLFFMQGVLAGLAWATKILTDPFHDIMLYWRAPLHLLRGELLDPMHHVRGH
ncbi:Mpo1-like protein [Rubrivivax sp. A210]|uniref:Mpo1-like protein n=1 Tax=Rubrivivax sp. A210 TaxID=2772301 RepID=UPI00191B6CCE|nr:Mpo1-like protein [Rubrivivax sp. A210]